MLLDTIQTMRVLPDCSYLTKSLMLGDFAMFGGASVPVADGQDATHESVHNILAHAVELFLSYKLSFRICLSSPSICARVIWFVSFVRVFVSCKQVYFVWVCFNQKIKFLKFDNITLITLLFIMLFNNIAVLFILLFYYNTFNNLKYLYP